MRTPMCLIRVWLPVAAAFLLFASSATAYTVTLDPGTNTSTLVTEVMDATIGDSDPMFPGSLSYMDTSTISIGTNSSESDYDLSNTGFNITFNHSRDEASGSRALSFGAIYFSVDENVNYSATGSYTAMDDSGRRILLQGSLTDTTLASVVFNSMQQSFGTQDESFTLGGPGGIDDDSLTGTLLAGHEYRFFYNAFIEATPSTLTGATATGSINLSFSVIPEPSAALLFGIGFGAVGIVTKRRRLN